MTKESYVNWMFLYYRNMFNMDPFDCWEGSQWLGLKWPKALQTISEWCFNKRKELEDVTVKYELSNDWTISEKSQIVWGRTANYTVMHTGDHYKLHYVNGEVNSYDRLSWERRIRVLNYTETPWDPLIL